MSRKTIKSAPAKHQTSSKRVKTGDAQDMRLEKAKRDGKGISPQQKRQARPDQLRILPSDPSSRSASPSPENAKSQLVQISNSKDSQLVRGAKEAMPGSSFLEKRSSNPTRSKSDHALSPRLGLLRPRSPASSIFSTQTFQTTTSHSSNRTVTQESYEKARRNTQNKINVFDFLEEEEEEEEERKKNINDDPMVVAEEEEHGEVWDSDSSSSSGSCDGSCCASQPDTDEESVHSSGAWDSGVSMSGDSPTLSRKRPMPLFEPVQGTETHLQDKPQRKQGHVHEDAYEEKTPVPGSFPRIAPSPLKKPPPAPSPPPAYQQPARQPPSFDSDPSQQPKRLGYELLASTLTVDDGEGPTPIYRRFEHLQHRSLLHLQDTISELEGELKVLDEHIAPLSTDAHGHHHPQSRRLDRVHPGIASRRHQVLDGLSYYLAQYNQLLSTHHTLNIDHNIPDPNHIKDYKSFLQRHQPIPANEATFLQHAADLVLLNKRHDRSHSAFVSGMITSLGVLIFAFALSRIL